MSAAVAERHEATNGLFRRARALELEIADGLGLLGIPLPKVRAKLDHESQLAAALEEARARTVEGLDEIVVKLQEVRDLRWRAVLQFERDAQKYAQKFAKYTKSAGLDDVLAEVWQGLYEASKRFDPEEGLQFQTYAQWWARAWVMRELGGDGLPAGAREQLRNVSKAWRMGIRDEAELAGWAKISVARLRKLRVASQPPVELDAPIEEEDGGLQGDNFADTPQAESDVFAQAHIARALDELPDRMRRVVEGRYPTDGSEPLSLRELADEFAVSKTMIQNLERDGLSRLRVSLAEGVPMDWETPPKSSPRDGGNRYAAPRRDQCVAIVLEHPEGIAVRDIARLVHASPETVGQTLQGAHRLHLVRRTGERAAVRYFPPFTASNPHGLQPAASPDQMARPWVDVAEEAGLPGPDGFPAPVVVHEPIPPNAREPDAHRRAIASPVAVPDLVEAAKVRWEERAPREAAFVEGLKAIADREAAAPPTEVPEPIVLRDDGIASDLASLRSDLAKIYASLDRLKVPPGPLDYRLGWVEGRFGP